MNDSESSADDLDCDDSYTHDHGYIQIYVSGLYNLVRDHDYVIRTAIYHDFFPTYAHDTNNRQLCG